jgi:nucleotidyltransferase/DNA polymerase involved in DNA repair
VKFLRIYRSCRTLSLDEAYLDVTENKKGIESANQIAKEIRQKIFVKPDLPLLQEFPLINF